MENYPHKVAALYADKNAALKALTYLRENGLAQEQLDLLEPQEIHNPPPKTNPEDGSLLPNEDYHLKLEPEGSETAWQVLKRHVGGAAIGGAVGGTVGAAAIAASGATLFLAAPLIGTLTMAAWGAMVGATVGTAIAMETGEFETFVTDAVKAGHFAVIIHATDTQEVERAKAILQKTLPSQGMVQSE